MYDSAYSGFGQSGFASRRGGLRAKLLEFNWAFLFLLCVVACFGFLMLYSVGRGWEPWAMPQITRFGIGVVVLLSVAVVDIRFWMGFAFPFYLVSLVLLVAVEYIGDVGMGAQRWIALGPLRIQPSELMKIALILAIARYYNGLTLEQVSNPLRLILPLLMIAIPVGLVLMQPDLGTALMLVAAGSAMIFMAGVHWLYIVGAIVAVVGAIPVAWGFLHDYQRQRVFTFLDPERDPLGAGFHILQSKIALGSGGLFGKGLGNGTQAHLNFLPEKQTDFIFTMLAEELGLIGAGTLLLLYMLVAGYAISVAMRARNHFGRLLAMGVTITFLLYIFINVSMVMGLVPVVGVPLPLVSYGGTSMLSLMFAFGLVMSVYIHRNEEMARKPLSMW